MRKFINQNFSSPSYKNIKLTEGKGSETCEKRKYFNSSDSEPSVKSLKFDEKTTNSATEREDIGTVYKEASDSRGRRIQDSGTFTN